MSAVFGQKVKMAVTTPSSNLRLLSRALRVSQGLGARLAQINGQPSQVRGWPSFSSWHFWIQVKMAAMYIFLE